MLSIAELFSIIGVVVIGIGLVITLVQNGRSHSNSMGKLEGTLSTEIKNIHKRLDDDDNGLGAIKGAVDKQALLCAKISTGLTGRVEGLEKKRRK
jgi:hypothetical protein